MEDRIASYGARSPDVAAWLAGQDAVFASCSDDTAMPALRSDAPVWLREDHAYQSAALAFYSGQNQQAAADFLEIARDPKSPWRILAPYLRVRVQVRAALDDPSPEVIAQAKTAVAQLAAAPAGALAEVAYAT